MLCDSPERCPDAFHFDNDFKTLHTPCEEVKPGEDITDLIARLKLAKRLMNGVGIAAPQIGVLKRVAIAQGDVLVNPHILKHGRDLVTEPEGCLSNDGYVVYVPRWRVITAEWLNERGERQVGTLSGYAARVFQHEVDHLDGKCIVDLL